MIKTKALNEFKGDISLSFGLMGDNRHLNKMFNNPTQNPRVSISFTVPIFDWGEKRARIKAQKVAQQINELEFHEEKVDIELNIRQVGVVLRISVLRSKLPSRMCKMLN